MRPRAVELPPPPRTLIRVGRIITSTYLPLFHRIEHRGKENWPREGPLLVVSNHPTYMDPWLIGMGTRRYVYWMAWDAIFHWPFFGKLVRAHHAFPVDLDKPKPSTLRRAREVLEQGGVLGVFPEGGRSTGTFGECDRFKPGVAWLALWSGAPILPVSIEGARRAWPMTRVFPLPLKIRVTYHPVIETATFMPDADRKERERVLTQVLEDTVRSTL